MIIPAFNEEAALPKVIGDIPQNLVREVVVVNNGSSDRTRESGEKAGATVILQPEKGYGSACLKGIEYLGNKQSPPDIVVFLDADYSDHPEEMPNFLKPLEEGGYDMVIGSRALGNREKGAMLPQAVFGNWLATRLIKFFYGYRFTDLGPFRAIKWQKLLDLEMEDPDFGWTVEMQVKAARKGLEVTEVPVSYRKRIGVSKVTGTIKGTVLAGYKILWTVFKYRFFRK